MANEVAKEEIIEYNLRNKIKKRFGTFEFIVIENEKVKLNELELLPQYIIKIVFLSTFANKYGVLKKDGVPLTRDDVIYLLKINETTFKIFYKKMKDKGILKKENGEYKLSKGYFITGAIGNKRPNMRFVKLYNETMQELYQNSRTKEYKAFEIAMSILPFIRQSNHIVKCGEDYLTFRDILNINGIPEKEYKRISKVLKSLKLSNGELFIKYLTDSFYREDILNSKIIINPRVVFNGLPESFEETYNNFLIDSGNNNLNNEV